MHESKRSSYQPKYDGMWVNKGTDFDEKWEWVEQKNAKTYYINVYHSESDYIISVSYSPRIDSLDTIDCRDEREVEVFLDALEQYYGTFGRTVIRKEL